MWAALSSRQTPRRSWASRTCESAIHRRLVALLRDGRAAVGQRDDIVALLARCTHRALDAAIRQEAAEGDGFDPIRREQLLQIGIRERVEALLARNDEVAGERRHLLAELRVPRALDEERILGAAGEDANGLVRIVSHVRLELDRHVDDEPARGAHLLR